MDGARASRPMAAETGGQDVSELTIQHSSLGERRRRAQRGARVSTETTRPVAPAPAVPKAVVQRGDRVFSGAATTAGVLILLVLAGVAVFLLAEAAPALTAPAEAIPGGDGLVAYIWPLVFGTLLSAVL